jgi:hypothetical protein
MSRGGRGLGIASLSAGDRGADGDASRADGRTLGDIVLPKGGNHGPRTHLAVSAATISSPSSRTLKGDILLEHVGLLPTSVGLSHRRLSSTLYPAGSVPLHRGGFLLKHVGFPHLRPFSTLHLTGSTAQHRGVVPIKYVGLAQRACSGGVPRGVERLQVIETPTLDVAVRRSLSLSLSGARAQPQPLSRASRRRLRLRALRIRARRVSKHFGALLSLGNVDPLGAPTPQIACAI